jgi:hypothetical protein
MAAVEQAIAERGGGADWLDLDVVNPICRTSLCPTRSGLVQIGARRSRSTAATKPPSVNGARAKAAASSG